LLTPRTAQSHRDHGGLEVCPQSSFRFDRDLRSIRHESSASTESLLHNSGSRSRGLNPKAVRALHEIFERYRCGFRATMLPGVASGGQKGATNALATFKPRAPKGQPEYRYDRQDARKKRKTKKKKMAGVAAAAEVETDAVRFPPVLCRAAIRELSVALAVADEADPSSTQYSNERVDADLASKAGPSSRRPESSTSRRPESALSKATPVGHGSGTPAQEEHAVVPVGKDCVLTEQNFMLFFAWKSRVDPYHTLRFITQHGFGLSLDRSRGAAVSEIDALGAGGVEATLQKEQSSENYHELRPGSAGRPGPAGGRSPFSRPLSASNAASSGMRRALSSASSERSAQPAHPSLRIPAFGRSVWLCAETPPAGSLQTTRGTKQVGKQFRPQSAPASRPQNARDATLDGGANRRRPQAVASKVASQSMRPKSAPRQRF